MTLREVPSSPSKIIASSHAFQHVLHLAERVAPTMLPTLIEGATGSGKEVLAQYIHHLGRNPEGAFVDVNCGAIPENLFESELFGHVKGAFTGAVANRTGYMEMAGNGTLFLDEIGEMPLSVQPKLLRALETRTFRPVGSDEIRHFKGRIISATHCDLLEKVKEKSFREDLYYRISVFFINVPPLCERKEDIPHLINHFSSICGRKITFDTEAVLYMKEYLWPGNIRELKNFIDRMAILSDALSIDAGSVRKILVPTTQTTAESFEKIADTLLAHPAGDKLAMAETLLIDRAMQLSNGNKTAAARLLGIDRKAVERHQRKSKNMQQEMQQSLVLGRAHMERGDLRAAVAVLEEAISWVPEIPLTIEEQRILCDLCHLLCISHQGIEGWLSADALRYNEKAMRLARKIEDETVLSSQLFWSWASQLMSLDIRKARATAQEMLLRAQNMKNPRLIDEAYVALANTSFWFGDCQETLTCLAASGFPGNGEKDYAAPHGLDLLALTIMFKGLSDFQLGTFSEARLAMDQLKQRGMNKNIQAFHRVLSLQGAAWLACLFDDLETMEFFSQELEIISAKHGFSFFLGLGKFFRGCALAARHRYTEAEQAMAEGYEKHILFQGGKLFHSFQAWKRGQLLLRINRLEECETLVSRAIDVAIEHQERVYLAELMELRSRVHLASGQFEEAQQGFASALSTALAIGTVPVKIRAATQLARLHESGREASRLYKSLGLPPGFERQTFLPVSLSEDLKAFISYCD